MSETAQSLKSTIRTDLTAAMKDKDPLRTGFVELKRLVMSLEGFHEEPGHPCNEKILETIQRFWIEEREDLRSDD